MESFDGPTHLRRGKNGQRLRYRKFRGRRYRRFRICRRNRRIKSGEGRNGRDRDSSASDEGGRRK